MLYIVLFRPYASRQLKEGDDMFNFFVTGK